MFRYQFLVLETHILAIYRYKLYIDKYREIRYTENTVYRPGRPGQDFLRIGWKLDSKFVLNQTLKSQRFAILALCHR